MDLSGNERDMDNRMTIALFVWLWVPDFQTNPNVEVSRNLHTCAFHGFLKGPGTVHGHFEMLGTSSKESFWQRFRVWFLHCYMIKKSSVSIGDTAHKLSHWPAISGMFDGNEPTDVSSANYIYLVLHPYLAPTSSTHLYRNIIFVTTTIKWVKLPYNLVMIVGGAIHLEWIQVSPTKWWIWAGKLCCLALSMEIFDIWHFSTISSNKHDWSTPGCRVGSPCRSVAQGRQCRAQVRWICCWFLRFLYQANSSCFFFEAMLPTPIDSNTSSTSMSTSPLLRGSWHVMACVRIQPGQQKQKPWKQRPRPSGAPVRRRAASRAWPIHPIPGLYLALPGYQRLMAIWCNLMQHVLHDVPHDVDNPLWYLWRWFELGGSVSDIFLSYFWCSDTWSIKSKSEVSWSLLKSL